MNNVELVRLCIPAAPWDHFGLSLSISKSSSWLLPLLFLCNWLHTHTTLILMPLLETGRQRGFLFFFQAEVVASGGDSFHL